MKQGPDGPGGGGGGVKPRRSGVTLWDMLTLFTGLSTLGVSVAIGRARGSLLLAIFLGACLGAGAVLVVELVGRRAARANRGNPPPMVYLFAVAWFLAAPLLAAMLVHVLLGGGHG